MEAALVGKLSVGMIILRNLQSILISHGNQSSFLSIKFGKTSAFGLSAHGGSRRVMPQRLPFKKRGPEGLPL